MQSFFQKYHIRLNRQQEVAVSSVEGPVLLLAVPGSGKTTVLISRLGYMVLSCGISPESILTVTYTVAATADMRARFVTKFGEELGDRMEFRTINGLSQKILQYYAGKTGKTPFSVADKEASVIAKEAFRKTTGEFATESDLKTVQLAITYTKNMRLTEEEIEKFSVEVENFPQIYKEYNAELRKRKLIDYDDQMVYALRILEQFPEVLSYFQRKYHYICVDEAQDTSKIQHEIINLLAGAHGNLFMVGDEDQSIYGFRAAYPEALISFEKNHPGAKVLLMEENYRSREEIVEAADGVIQDNRLRHQKRMKAARDGGGQVREVKLRSRRAQYAYLCKVAAGCEKETAVLYRNNESALPLIDRLDREGIAYQLKKSELTFFSHPVVRDICDYIRLCEDDCDTEAFLRIYYKMGAGITKKIAFDVAEENRGKQSLLTLVADHRDATPFIRKQSRAMDTHFRNMRKEEAGKALFRILKFMGYKSYAENHNLDYAKAEVLLLLADSVDTIEALPKRLAYLQDLTGEQGEPADSRFLLSTIHSAKGLEYERVYLMDMIQGILPGVEMPKNPEKNREALSAFEEERRLFYVGMTRAKEELYLFTFPGDETSEFAKRALDCMKKANNMRDWGRMLEAYEMGVLVEHEKFGRGVIVKRTGEKTEILFDNEEKSRTIFLPFALERNLIRVL